VWRWTSNGQYTSKSCYNALFEGVLVSSSWRLNWKSWAAPRVKFFIWLACLDRCSTWELDLGAACTASTLTSYALLVMRSVRGDNDASGSSEEEW
jgi:hypothetical protein